MNIERLEKLYEQTAKKAIQAYNVDNISLGRHLEDKLRIIYRRLWNLKRMKSLRMMSAIDSGQRDLTCYSAKTVDDMCIMLPWLAKDFRVKSFCDNNRDTIAKAWNSLN